MRKEGSAIFKHVDLSLNDTSPVCRKAVLSACCLLATLFVVGCTTLRREPGLPVQPTETARPATPTPTPVPVIKVDNITVKARDLEGKWEIFGIIRNISNDALTDLELSVSALDPEGNVQAHGTFLPALRQLSPGDTTPFRAEFGQIDIEPQPEQILVELASFRKSTTNALEISVDRISAQPNLEGGTTYLGYFSNGQLEYAEFHNVEAFMINQAGEPIAAAQQIVALTGIAPLGHIPFSAEFREDFGEVWPEFYLDASPAEAPDGRSPLWTVSEPRLFLTSQGIPYYLIEIKNTAFAPQTMHGVFTLSEGNEIMGVLPIHSPAPIAAQSSWFFTLEPNLALPADIRNDEQAISALIADIMLDPLATRGTSGQLFPIDLTIESVETIGGSIFFRGTIGNSNEQELYTPVIYVTLRDASGEVISANSEKIEQVLQQGSTVEFTLSVRIPAGVAANTLEFDLNAIALSTSDTVQEVD